LLARLAAPVIPAALVPKVQLAPAAQPALRVQPALRAFLGLRDLKLVLLVQQVQRLSALAV
jgi:hypothetical protein